MRYSVVIAWTLEENQSEKINANQPGSGRLEESAEATEPEPPPPPQPQSTPSRQLLSPAKEAKHLPLEQVEVSLPPPPSVEAHQLPLLSPPEKMGGNEHEKVMVSIDMVVEIGGVMAWDGGK